MEATSKSSSVKKQPIPAPSPDETIRRNKPEVLREKERRIAGGRNWYVFLWLAALHVLAISAFWFFSWQAVVLAVALHWFTGGIGVCLGFHRLLTHSSFQTYRPVKWLFAWIGGLSGEGSAVDWVADHRKHHAYSDLEGDPHSPNDGSWWSHAGWLGWKIHGPEKEAHTKRWAPDLLKDPGMAWIDRLFLPSQFALGFALFGMGWWIGGSFMAWSLVTWGMFLRLVLVLHATWLVNSASHMWGYRNYETTDKSRNNWWVALITYGEGWHNNHHAYPRMANHGHKWWEIDMTYNAIQILQRLGLAWDVVDYKRKSEKLAEAGSDEPENIAA
jgi:stearoyl-CoA desaturase (delta-9 desaturase)